VVDRVAAEAVVGAAEIAGAASGLGAALAARLAVFEASELELGELAARLCGGYRARVLAVASNVGEDAVVADEGDDLLFAEPLEARGENRAREGRGQADVSGPHFWQELFGKYHSASTAKLTVSNF